MLDIAKLGLKTGDQVLFDTVSLIYLIDRKPNPTPREMERRKVLQFFVNEAQSQRIRLVASTIAWVECLAGPLGSSDIKRADSFREELSNSQFIMFEPVDIAIAEETARLLSFTSDMRGNRKTRFEFVDAIHIATAVVLGACAVLTNDEVLRDAVEARAAELVKVGKKDRQIRVLLIDDLIFEI